MVPEEFNKLEKKIYSCIIKIINCLIYEHQAVFIYYDPNVFGIAFLITSIYQFIMVAAKSSV